ncbi:MAG: DUF1598 domain-containing protein [Planctomycetales bacterium]
MTGGPDIGPWNDDVGGDGGDDGGGGDGSSGGTAGEMIPFQNGVAVDPNGLLRQESKHELAAHLTMLGIRARNADLNQEMSRASTLRFVSLTRLEKEIATRLKSGQPVLETMRRLAGLTQIQYVFVIPEENELVIAGPAEGWKINQHGLPVGQASGRPVLHLDDLVTVLRTFGPGGKGVFGCSIDPRPAHLKATKEYIDQSAARGPLAPNAVPGWMRQIEDRMGLQDIVIYGVPADSRVARVIIDADYRMKLIGIGKLNTGAGIPSVFDLMASQKDKDKLPLNALRWWLTMNYSSVLHSGDKNVYEMKGSSVLVKSEDQMVTATGDRIHTGKASRRQPEIRRQVHRTLPGTRQARSRLRRPAECLRPRHDGRARSHGRTRPENRLEHGSLRPRWRLSARPLARPPGGQVRHQPPRLRRQRYRRPSRRWCPRRSPRSAEKSRDGENL